MFIECSTELTISDLNDVETKLGFNLPEELKEHYLQFNGGIPVKPCYYAQDIDLETEIAAFSSMKYKNSSTLLEESYLDFINRGALPKKYLPFANDWGGNLFCMDLETGNVVLIWMDLGEVTERCINFLSNSFETFINNLEKCEDECCEDA
ncbi:SMI1/KNR4 family protein [Lysinibacillus sp. NPDC095746]|uniref:SMI1/KNR4 family protein n=1 Tax=Lysinibacillus sp. NPDC095746 TaxID=3364134 RepID=UPI00381042B2